MDFSKVKEIAIPEGKVKEISIGDQIVWKKKSGSGIPLKITGSASGFILKCTVNGATINNNDLVPLGAEVVVVLDTNNISAKKSTYIYYNDSPVASNYQAKATYKFTLPENAKSFGIYLEQSSRGQFIDGYAYITVS